MDSGTSAKSIANFRTAASDDRQEFSKITGLIAFIIYAAGFLVSVYGGLVLGLTLFRPPANQLVKYVFESGFILAGGVLLLLIARWFALLSRILLSIANNSAA